ncbi:MAG: hypothetical protein AB7G28_21150 [Pirellulales bacterium]
MTTSRSKKWLLGTAAAVAMLIPFGIACGARADDGALQVPVRTLTYRADGAGAPVQEVRWGRGFYRGPYGYYGGYYGRPADYYPRYYSGYRGGYAPYGDYPYGGYYGPRYYGPGYGGYYGGGYYGGGVRVGRWGVLWR